MSGGLPIGRLTEADLRVGLPQRLAVSVEGRTHPVVTVEGRSEIRIRQHPDGTHVVPILLSWAKVGDRVAAIHHPLTTEELLELARQAELAAEHVRAHNAKAGYAVNPVKGGARG